MSSTPKPVWRRRPLLVALGALAVVVAVVVAVVSLSEEPEAAGPTRELDPLAFGKRLWTADELTALRSGGDVRLRDDLLLTEYDEGLMPVDVATGAVSWIQQDFVELSGAPVAFDPGAHQLLPFVVRHGDGVGVLVGYRVFSCEPVEPGLALLAGDDGALVWRTPLAPAGGCSPDAPQWQQQLWAADDTTALVSVRPTLADPDDANQTRTVAVDVATGQRRWAHQGAWPQGIAGGVAVVAPREPLGAVFTPGTVTGLDLVTGQQKWTVADRYYAADLVRVAGDVLVVETMDAERSERTVRVLDAASGRELATLPDVRTASCVADATLVACTADPLRGGVRLVTFRVKDRAVLSVPLADHRLLRSVVDGRISVEVRAPKPAIVMLDRTGSVIDKDPPGVLLAVADDRAFVLATADGQESLAVYQVRG